MVKNKLESLRTSKKNKKQVKKTRIFKLFVIFINSKKFFAKEIFLGQKYENLENESKKFKIWKI